MRVLLVSDSYPPLIGGATRATQHLGRQLTGRGHVVTVATAWQRDLPAVEQDGDVEVHRLRGLVSRATRLSADPSRYTPPPFPDPELVWRFHRLARRTRPDIVHSYGWLSYSALTALAGRRVPVLLAARDYANVCAVRTMVRQGAARGSICDGPAPAKCLECATAFYGTPKGAAAVLGVFGGRPLLRAMVRGLHSTSSYTQATVRRPLRLHPGRPDAVVPDFREDDRVGRPDPAIVARLPREPYILFVGSFRRIKGDSVLLEAYSRLEDPPPLVMIGALGPEALPAFPSGVTPMFDVPHDTVMAAWDRALFGVFPSVVPEALGNVVHEAMSRGRAVVGTTPGGHTDIVVDGDSGLLVPSGDVDALTVALRRLIDDPGLRDRLGCAARERARRFTADEVVPTIEALYEEVIRVGPRHRRGRLSTRGPHRRRHPQGAT